MSKKIMRITDLTPDDQNANQGTLRGSYMVEESLQQLGVGRSIVVDQNGKVIAGNKTLQAAIDAGFDEVEVIITDGKRLIVHQRNDLDLNDTSGMGRQLAYADNRASEVSLSWDANQVITDLENGVDLDQWFMSSELEDIQQEANLDAEINAQLDSRASDKTGLNRNSLVRIAISVNDVAIFERAIKETGLVSRGDALKAISEFYINAEKR